MQDNNLLARRELGPKSAAAEEAFQGRSSPRRADGRGALDWVQVLKQIWWISLAIIDLIEAKYNNILV
jgi:hypothetical protein